MSNNTHPRIPSPLSALERDFARWRRARRRGERIPRTLWAKAVSAARAHSAEEVAGFLRLDLGRLRARLGKDGVVSPAPVSPANSSGFVSVVSAADPRCNPAGSVTVEVHRPDGSCLVIRQDPAQALGAVEVTQLVSSFWEGR